MRSPGAVLLAGDHGIGSSNAGRERLPRNSGPHVVRVPTAEPEVPDVWRGAGRRRGRADPGAELHREAVANAALSELNHRAGDTATRHGRKAQADEPGGHGRQRTHPVRTGDGGHKVGRAVRTLGMHHSSCRRGLQPPGRSAASPS